MHKSLRLQHGVYAITPDTGQTTEDLLSLIEQVMKGGIKILQYRSKISDENLRVRQAKKIKTLCRDYKVPLIINDDVALAISIEADGIHLGKSDTPCSVVRKVLEEGKIIGISCYDSVSLAQNAERDGADYVAFGSFYPSKSKPNAPLCSIETLKTASAILNIPIVAIGGIQFENAGKLVDNGADYLAVIDQLFNHPSPTLAANKLSMLF
jgi:thiamine-phosphate pyrophosphorylase